MPENIDRKSVSQRSGACQTPDLQIIQRIKAVLGDGDLNPTEKCVLIHLMLAAGKAGEAIWRQRTIGSALRLSERTARRCVSRLDALGKLETEHRGWHRANCYRVSKSGRTQTDASKESSSRKDKSKPIHQRHPHKSAPDRKPPQIEYGDDDKTVVRKWIATNSANDAEHIMQTVQRLLGRGGMGEGWKDYRDRIERTTDPQKARAGVYVDAAKELIEEARQNIRTSVAVEPSQPVPCPHKCMGGRISEHQYCECQMGRDLERAEKRPRSGSDTILRRCPTKTGFRSSVRLRYLA